MKYKYKQIVFGITAVVMVVGLAALHTKPTSAGIKNEQGITASVDEKENTNEENKDDTQGAADIASSSAVASDGAVDTDVTPASTFAAGNNKEVTDLITEYLNAKLDCSEERLKEVVDDMSKIDITDISKRTEKIESYADIQVYTVDGPVEGSYVAAVHEKLKISGINTPSSGLNFFYVKPDENGKLKICFSDVEEQEAEEYYKIIDENEDIKALSKKVEDEFVNELAEDEDLLKYVTELNSVSEESEEESSEESSEE